MDFGESRFLEINSRARIPLREFTFTYSRSSGAGGQNVNKVNSKATLRWNLHASSSLPFEVRERFLQAYGNRISAEGDVVVSSEKFRDQERNVQDCLEKLAAWLRSVWAAPKVRKKTKPTKSSQRKRLESKRKHSDKKKLRREW